VTGQRTITLPDGGTYRHELEFLDDDGSPVDVSGYDYAAHVGPVDGGDSLAAFTVDATGAADGLVSLTLDCSTFLRNVRGPLRWQVWETATGEPFPILDGPAYVRPRVGYEAP
jgi:hypothetical protein